ncbi:hypothetical protein B0J18DRAFT_128038 [Chaetomium sp. MPI-SDFR-AT-0129]|nr:hypothetical protein B0J18DRAFT_128038 [Chaetomium sp. MPI-SDFR-AT-0129]
MVCICIVFHCSGIIPYAYVGLFTAHVGSRRTGVVSSDGPRPLREGGTHGYAVLIFPCIYVSGYVSLHLG